MPRHRFHFPRTSMKAPRLLSSQRSEIIRPERLTSRPRTYHFGIFQRKRLSHPKTILFMGPWWQAAKYRMTASREPRTNINWHVGHLSNNKRVAISFNPNKVKNKSYTLAQSLHSPAQRERKISKDEKNSAASRRSKRKTERARSARNPRVAFSAVDCESTSLT